MVPGVKFFFQLFQLLKKGVDLHRLFHLRHLDNADLKLEPRLRTIADRRFQVSRQFYQSEDILFIELRSGVCVAHPVYFRGFDQAGRLRGPGDEKVAEMFREAGKEFLDVESIAHNFFHKRKACLRIVRFDAVAHPEEKFLVDDIQQD